MVSFNLVKIHLAVISMLLFKSVQLSGAITSSLGDKRDRCGDFPTQPKPPCRNVPSNVPTAKKDSSPSPYLR